MSSRRDIGVLAGAVVALAAVVVTYVTWLHVSNASIVGFTFGMSSDGLAISVRDHGHGIAPSDLPHLFRACSAPRCAILRDQLSPCSQIALKLEYYRSVPLNPFVRPVR